MYLILKCKNLKRVQVKKDSSVKIKFSKKLKKK